MVLQVTGPREAARAGTVAEGAGAGRPPRRPPPPPNPQAVPTRCLHQSRGQWGSVLPANAEHSSDTHVVFNNVKSHPLQEDRCEQILFVSLAWDEGGVFVHARTQSVHKEQRGGEPGSPRDTPGQTAL